MATLLLAPLVGAQDDPVEEPTEPRRYAVELIVFTYEENVSVGTEIFPPDELPPDAWPNEAGDFTGRRPESGPEGIAIDAAGNPIPEFTDTDTAVAGMDDAALAAAEEAERAKLAAMDAVLLLADEYSMQRALEQIERLDVYEPIMHIGWTQATLAPEDSAPLDLAYFGRPPAGLEGSFMLYLGRYLHLVVDLTLDAAADDPRAAGNEPLVMFGDEAIEYDIGRNRSAGAVRYRIQEDRIVKNGDVRYFDHPRFGVLAKVTRIEDPEDDPAVEPDAGSAALVVNPVQ